MPNVRALSFQIFLIRFGPRRFFEGFYYFKWLEYPLVYNHLDIRKGERYLDIGSGKSIFPLFVLAKKDCYVYIADDESIINDSFRFYNEIISKLKLSNLVDKKIYLLKISDNTFLDFPDNYFDKISCISTLEHVKGNGDSEMIKEIARILKRGGRAVITFPFNNGDYMEEDDALGVGYFQRRYNLPAIKSRVIDPSGLEVKKVIYFGERNAHIGRLYRQNKVYGLHWVMSLVSICFWRICHSYDGSFRDFHEETLDKEYIGAVCIVMEKG